MRASGQTVIDSHTSSGATITLLWTFYIHFTIIWRWRKSGRYIRFIPTLRWTREKTEKHRARHGLASSSNTMLGSMTGGTRWPAAARLLLLAMAASRTVALSQEYCASFNTGLGKKTCMYTNAGCP